MALLFKFTYEWKEPHKDQKKCEEILPYCVVDLGNDEAQRKPSLLKIIHISEKS